MTLEEEIAVLRSKVYEVSQSYRLGHPIMSAEEYDGMVQELHRLEGQQQAMKYYGGKLKDTL